MKIYVNVNAGHDGNGTEQMPFRHINDAAKIAQPGDEVWVAPGVYREYVDPVHAGREDARITYRSVEPLGAVITGAERIQSWVPYKENVWVCRVANSLFGNYNPYTTMVYGDWYFAKADKHTGCVYLNNRALYEAGSVEECIKAEVYECSWVPEESTYKWYTEQDQEKDETVIYANFHGADPNEENVEINVRRECFMPSKTGVGYITVSGFVVTKAATTWAPPAAYQDGMIGPHWSKGWIIEDCEISNSKCAGISLGKYFLDTNIYEILEDFSGRMINTEVLGKAFEPEEFFENPDGTPITFDTDYFGGHRGAKVIPGPFAEKEDVGKNVNICTAF